MKKFRNSNNYSSELFEVITSHWILLLSERLEASKFAGKLDLRKGEFDLQKKGEYDAQKGLIYSAKRVNAICKRVNLECKSCVRNSRRGDRCGRNKRRMEKKGEVDQKDETQSGVCVCVCVCV